MIHSREKPRSPHETLHIHHGIICPCSEYQHLAAIPPGGIKVISEKEIASKIRSILNHQRLAVLSTQRGGQPYSSLMAFAFTDDLKNLLVATGKGTRKHQNITQDARVSLLVDNRSNREEDFHEAIALTILGRAKIIQEDKQKEYSGLYLARHPYLDTFLNSPSTSFFKISVSHYLLVSQFQNVLEYSIGENNDPFS